MRLSPLIHSLALPATGMIVLAALPVAGQRPVEEDSVAVYFLEPVLVEGRIDDLTGLVRSASVGYIGSRDLHLRPRSREGELLEAIPGMILTQHSGSGKSNQIFVRGFNLDHGTDFSTRLEGMPLNIPTHAHGQGYTDITFMIPELVDHIEYSLGNYYAHIGDFGAAGGATLRLRRTLEHSFVTAELGEGAQRRLLAAASTGAGEGGTLLAGAELRRYDGVWEVPENLRKLSGMVRYSHVGASSSFSLLALGYAGSWQSSDQIPRRAVETGLVGRFGQIDTTLGGESARYSLSATWDRTARRSSLSVDAYAVRYDLDLFSNFTYLLDDPIEGDQIRQEDDGRWTFGVNAEHLRVLDGARRDHHLTIGAQVRNDRADVALSSTSERELVARLRADLVSQWSAGLYAELTSSWSDVFKTVLGVRGDLYRFDVASDRAENTGETSDAILSPKVSVVFPLAEMSEVYVSGGLGFHSNDARGTVTTVDPVTGEPTEPVDPLVRSRGAELGLRASPAPGVRSTVSLWTIDLDSELLFVGDAGSTEPSDPSRRVGLTFANFYRITPSWSVDLDLSLTRARFRDVDDSVDRVPGAMSRVIAAGFSHEPGEDGLFGAVRLRHLGPYPLLEDDSERAPAATMVNTSLGYRLGDLRMALSVLNAFDVRDSDIRYFYSSRLPGEPTGGVPDVHFHPVQPRQLRLTVSWGI